MSQEIRPEEADKGAYPAQICKPKPSREPDCHDVEGFCCAACAQKFWTRFQNLPAELREMVYVRSFQALPNISVPSSTELGSNSSRTPVVPPVCYVNKSVLAESLPAILASDGKAIVVQHHLGLEVLSKFLARVPDERTIKSVQELHLPWEYAFSPHLYPGTLDLPFACQVEAMLCLHKVYEANGVVVHTFKSAQEVTSFFKLRQVFELPMLRSLTIRCYGGDLMAKQVGCKPEDIFANLVSVASAEADKKSADFELMFKFNEWSGQVWGFCRWS